MMDMFEGEGMEAQVDGQWWRFCNEECKSRFAAAKATESPAAEDGGLIDPVCNMEVNASWGFVEQHGGKTYYFCTEKCRETFQADPGSYLGSRCTVCDVPVDPASASAYAATYMDNTYLLCSSEHRAEFKGDPASYFMHTMWGIPPWLYYISIAAVLLASFIRFESAGHSEGAPQSSAPDRPDRVDLMRFAPVRWIAHSRPFRFASQLVVVTLFFLIIAAGLFGNQNPALNIAPLLTWTIWWCALVVLIMFAGKAWCYVCPWDAVATWLEKLRLWKKTDSGLGLAMDWPKKLRNVWVATAFFIALTWVELGFGVTMRPNATAYLAIGMLVMTIISAFLFDKKSFCRYGCLVGRVSGLYAMFSGVEVRSRSRDVCRACTTKECVKGSESAYGCPTFENPARMEVNTYCTQCTECIQACPHDNLGVNMRPWGADLAVEGKPASDEAYLALLMLAITGFHGLTMTPAWPQLLEWLDLSLGLGRIGAFSLGMTGLMVSPLCIYAVLVRISYAIAIKAPASAPARPAVSFRDYFIRYAYCVLPIALFYHLAHNLEHLLMEGPKVLRLLSDPFGSGQDLFGTATMKIVPLVSLDTLWILQVILVGVGHVYSLWAAQKISRRTFAGSSAAWKGQLPILAGMIAFSIFSLWLLKQPMEMRISAM